MRYQKDLEGFLYELGYDGEREYVYGKNGKTRKFMREIDCEENREVQRYIEDVEDCEEEEWELRLMRGEIKRSDD